MVVVVVVVVEVVVDAGARVVVVDTTGAAVDVVVDAEEVVDAGVDVPDVVERCASSVLHAEATMASTTETVSSDARFRRRLPRACLYAPPSP